MRYLAPIIEATIGIIAVIFGFFLYAGVSGSLYWYGWLIIGFFTVGGISLGLYGVFTGIESAVSAAKG